MDPTIDDLKQWMIRLCAKLNEKHMLAAGDGNISAKLSDDTILMTPRGRNKAFLSPEDFALIDIAGNTLDGEPSTEAKLHLQVYRSCASARAVVHAHPPHVLGWSIAHPHDRCMPTDSMPEVVLGIGEIPVAAYGRPGTQDLADSVKTLLEHGYRAMVMARHGALSWGTDLIDAYNGMERMEHAALILAKAQLFGSPVPMSKEELTWLRHQFDQRARRNL